MNREWSEQNKAVQAQLKKEATFTGGIETLLELRESLFDVLSSLEKELDREDFSACPFPNANGYHSKTIAYSIWHIFRIEDITVHSLICADEQVFFAGNYRERIGSPIITTGNELVKQQISAFSEALDLEMLYQYSTAVKDSTNQILKNLSYSDLTRKMTEKDSAFLKSLDVVSTDPNAVWLIDYWCGKTVRGLIQMPLSRHWIMHIEACLRIRNKICPDR